MTNEEIIAGYIPLTGVIEETKIKLYTETSVIEMLKMARADERSKLQRWLNNNEAVDSFILPDDMKKYILQTSKK